MPGKTAPPDFQSLELPRGRFRKSTLHPARSSVQVARVNRPATFQPLPAREPLALHWPTPNRSLFSAPDFFFARTRANPDYGRPGWTRDCGRRFHRGCDIAPVAPRAAGRTTTVLFSDCERKTEYPSEEPVFFCDDEIFALSDGHVCETCADESASPLGLHIVIEHRWPTCRKSFFTLYAHLGSIEIPVGGIVRGGRHIGRMGQTSSSADARNWMAVAPHLHLEISDENRDPYDPEHFLRTFLMPEMNAESSKDRKNRSRKLPPPGKQLIRNRENK